MENTETEVTEIFSPEVIYQQDKAAIDIQISTAKAYPRNIKRAVENAIAIATMDRATAAKCTYSVPRGGKPITGKSIGLAKIVAQCWGNMRIESKVINIDSKHTTSQGICWDLESNLAMKGEVKRSIVGNKGRFNDDMITVTGNAGNSIALRNAIFAVVPQGITDKVYVAAMQMLTGDISDETKLITRRKQVVDGLCQTYEITEIEVLKSIGKASLSHVTADDLVVLIGIGTAIKDGDTTVEEAFKGAKTGATTEPAPTHEEMLNLLELKQHLLNKNDHAAAWRIVNEGETASFLKLKKQLLTLKDK